MNANRVLRAGTALVVLALLAGAVGVFWPGESGNRVTAYFDRAVGLYKGNEVRILGVRVGEVTAIEPQGTSVRVEMTYDAEQKIPADAHAVVISPTLVSDRYVQLAPAYTGGPVLDDEATIPQSRTATPVELDRIYAALNDLSTALGPEGANKDGSLSQLLQVGAENLDGQGKKIHRTVENLSEATGTLADGSDDLFATVRNLQDFTTTLAKSDSQVEKFNRQLAAVSSQLEGDKEELAKALDHLSVALKDVEHFVRDNKGAISENVKELTEITGVLVKEQKALGEVLNKAPLALSNLSLAYNPVSGTLDTRTNFQQGQNPAMYLCSLVYSLGVPPKKCEPLLAPLRALRRDHLPLSLDLSFLTRMTYRSTPYRGEWGADEQKSDGGKDTRDDGSGSDDRSPTPDGRPTGKDERKGGRDAPPQPPTPSLGVDSSLEDMLSPGRSESGGSP